MKRYVLQITQEGIFNPDYAGYIGGRIELWDREADSAYPSDEFRFLIPSEYEDKFYDLFEGMESDEIPLVKMGGEGNCKETLREVRRLIGTPEGADVIEHARSLNL